MPLIVFLKFELSRIRTYFVTHTYIWQPLKSFGVNPEIIDALIIRKLSISFYQENLDYDLYITTCNIYYDLHCSLQWTNVSCLLQLSVPECSRQLALPDRSRDFGEVTCDILFKVAVDVMTPLTIL